jgi:hypothetical protein
MWPGPFKFANPPPPLKGIISFHSLDTGRGENHEADIAPCMRDLSIFPWSWRLSFEDGRFETFLNPHHQRTAAK